MVMRILEKSKEEFANKLKTMNTPLIKINYIEDALRGTIDIAARAYLGDILTELYVEMKMFDKAARALSNKASVSTTFKDKMELYCRAGDLMAHAQRLEEAEGLYVKAMREVTEPMQLVIKKRMKDAFLKVANEMWVGGRKSGAIKFYEKLIKMPLDANEKAGVKDKMMEMYKNMGRFSEMKILQGI